MSQCCYNNSVANCCENPVADDNIKVHFTSSDKSDAYMERKSKFLTAKYDKNAMKLIQKRLLVEGFVYDHLRILYSCINDEDDHDCDLDLDDLLDLDTEAERRLLLEEKLKDAPASPQAVLKFQNELLAKLLLL